MSSGNNNPIGVFDSGIGGLSVANAISGLLPKESLIYFADTGRVPYGPRTRQEITDFSFEITRFLLDHQCKMIVVACNTATAAALESLRKQWPDIPFVGMEPAVKPAAEATRSGKVGVLATLSTIRSERYAELMRRYAANVEVFENPCIGLVPLIEAGQLNAPETIEQLKEILTPMLAQQVDTLVLGCTHYPFLLPLLKGMVPADCKIIDPAPAVARQVARRLEHLSLAAKPEHPAEYQFFHSGPVADLSFFTDIPWFIHSVKSSK
ncbi:glutamate racemase [Lewinella sp. LCG006]|uniref:glutamate racemase n=1 Tax=Lewinella sp. LCG006 TaxID=3231911 RepID=UPI00345F2ACC